LTSLPSDLPRDIGGSDPERMAAPRIADYVTALFAQGGKSQGQSMAENDGTYCISPLFKFVTIS
jgi:hypothetical protein